MSKFTVTLLISYLFSDYVFASKQQVVPLSTTYMDVTASLHQDKAARIEKVIDRAHELIGEPYRLGGASVSKGFDCSGLLVYLFRSEAGINIPRTTTSMLNSKAKTVPRHNLKTGDAVFFKHNGGGRMNHVGIYIGDDRFIHAPRTGKTIRIDSLANSYWSKSYLSAKRFH